MLFSDNPDEFAAAVMHEWFSLPAIVPYDRIHQGTVLRVHPDCPPLPPAIAPTAVAFVQGLPVDKFLPLTIEEAREFCRSEVTWADDNECFQHIQVGGCVDAEGEEVRLCDCCHVADTGFRCTDCGVIVCPECHQSACLPHVDVDPPCQHGSTFVSVHRQGLTAFPRPCTLCGTSIVRGEAAWTSSLCVCPDDPPSTDLCEACSATQAGSVFLSDHPTMVPRHWEPAQGLNELAGSGPLSAWVPVARVAPHVVEAGGILDDATLLVRAARVGPDPDLDIAFAVNDVNGCSGLLGLTMAQAHAVAEDVEQETSGGLAQCLARFRFQCYYM
jgi:hypothetical protein